MNPLVKTVEAMCEAVRRGQDTFKGPYHNSTLVDLASFLLSKTGNRLRLKQIGDSRQASSNTSVVLYSGGIFSYLAMIRELRLRERVVLLKVSAPGDPSDDLAHGLEWSWVASQDLTRSPEENLWHHDFRHLRSIEPAAADMDVLVVSAPLNNVAANLKPLMLLAVASAVASEEGARSIVLGTCLDNNVRLHREASEVFGDFYGRPLKVRAPFADQRPLLVIKEHLDQGFTPSTLIEESLSCDAERQSMHPMCGHCWGCFRRFKLFEALGWAELHFKSNPWEAPNYARYEERWTKLNA